jgi:hypothetical protein
VFSRQQLIDAYADWLSNWSWDWFGTLTHRGFPCRKTVQRKFDLWIADLRREHGTQQFRYVSVVESGAHADNFHLHVLIGGLRKRIRPFPHGWRDRWQEIAGQAVIGKYDPNQGGIRYLLKTLLPDRDFEITLYLNEQAKNGASNEYQSSE